MKKLLLLAILILSSAFICENIQASNGDDKVIVVIRPRPTEHIPETTIPRQLIQPEVEAVLYCNSGNIVFTEWQCEARFRAAGYRRSDRLQSGFGFFPQDAGYPWADGRRSG